VSEPTRLSVPFEAMRSAKADDANAFLIFVSAHGAGYRCAGQAVSGKLLGSAP